MTFGQTEAARKGDLRAPMVLVHCVEDCSTDPDQTGRVQAAFETVAEHDTEAGVTTLTRVPAGE